MVVFFILVQAVVLICALWKGGGPERVVAFLLLAGSLSTLAVSAGQTSFHSVFWPVAWIDISLLVFLIVVASFADRFWPIWIAACQLLAVAGHGVRGYDPALMPQAYWVFVVLIAYPMLGIQAVGIWRHQHRARSGKEFDWTFQRKRCARARALSEREGRRGRTISPSHRGRAERA